MEKWTYADSLVQYLNPQLKLPLHILITNEETEYGSIMSRLHDIRQGFEIVAKLKLPDNSNVERIKEIIYQLVKDEINFDAPLFLHITQRDVHLN